MAKLNRPMLVLLAFLAGAFATSFQTRPVRGGARPYTPTCLEWLALEMEIRSHVELSDSTKFSANFVALQEEDAVLVYVRYLPTVDQSSMKSQIGNLKDEITQRAASRGWSGWLKIREDVKMVDQPVVVNLTTTERPK